MKTGKKIAIGCLSLPFVLVLLFWILGWVASFDGGFSKYRDMCKKINTYLNNPTERYRYDGELQRIVEMHKYPGVKHRGDVITAYLVPFDGFFQAMGHKLAVAMLGAPEDIEEKIYQAAKGAMDSEDYAFASYFFKILTEFDYKDSREFLVKARSKNRHGLRKGDFLNLGMSVWGSDGSLAPMAWKVADLVEDKFLLVAGYPVEYKVMDDHFCNWLNGEMFNSIFFNGSSSAIVPLDQARLEKLIDGISYYKEMVFPGEPQDPDDSKRYCQEIGNKIFLIDLDKYKYSSDYVFDELYPPYLKDRLAKIKSVSGRDHSPKDCCRPNDIPYEPKEWVDSIVAVTPSIFVDTLLLKRY